MIDVSNPEVLAIESVNGVLAEIGCSEKPIVLAFNKADSITDAGPLETLQTMYPEAVTISARTWSGPG